MNYPTISDTIYPVARRHLLTFRVSVLDSEPNVAHAIFSRHGGVSTRPYHSLNLSTATGDDADRVSRNIRLACQVLGLQTAQITTCRLVHGNEVITVDSANRRDISDTADGLVSSTPGIFLFMRFADCTPLLFYDPVVGAVGLAHAGWRGTIKNAAGSVITAMVRRLGCRAEDITAIIGPAIGPCCYQVGQEVITAVKMTFHNPADFLQYRDHDDSHAYFDLWAANQQQLSAAGLKRIVQTNLCTACHCNTFFSHRAEKGRTGRFGVIIGLNRGEEQ